MHLVVVVAAWPHFLICYNPMKELVAHINVAAWPHFLICYNPNFGNIYANTSCGLTAFSYLLQLGPMAFVAALVAALPHFLICYNANILTCPDDVVAAWPHFLICYNKMANERTSSDVAAWPHFLICYNPSRSSCSSRFCCGLTAFPNLLQPMST